MLEGLRRQFRPDDDPETWEHRLYVLGVLSHRLRKFGWEPMLAGLPARDRMVLSFLLFGRQQEVVATDACADMNEGQE